MRIIENSVRDAEYRVTFELGGDLPREEVARRMVAVFDAFHAIEVRVTAIGGNLHMATYIAVPVDVTIAALDAKAAALREAWEQPSIADLMSAAEATGTLVTK